MTFDRKYVLCAFAWAIVGMGLGLYMGISMNHSQLVTHAHILMVGFVMSFIYAVTHRLFLAGARRWLAWLQFCLHQLSAIVMLGGLFLMFGGVMAEPRIAPVVGIGAIGVLLALLLMAGMVLVTPRRATPE